MMSESQLEDVARVCNRYPDIQLTYSLPDGAVVAANESVMLQVSLEREDTAELRPVDAPRYCYSISLASNMHHWTHQAAVCVAS